MTGRRTFLKRFCGAVAALALAPKLARLGDTLDPRTKAYRDATYEVPHIRDPFPPRFVYRKGEYVLISPFREGKIVTINPEWLNAPYEISPEVRGLLVKRRRLITFTHSHC